MNYQLAQRNCVAGTKGGRKIKPSTVHSKEYPSMKKELKKKRASGADIILSDLRPNNQRHTEISKEEKNSFVSDLWRIGGDSGWTTLLDYDYDYFSLDDYWVDVLKEQCKQFQENLKSACEGKTYPFMADNIFGQAESEMWMFHRQCRITTSNCKDVICLKNGHTVCYSVWPRKRIKSTRTIQKRKPKF